MLYQWFSIKRCRGWWVNSWGWWVQSCSWWVENLIRWSIWTFLLTLDSRFCCNSVLELSQILLFLLDFLLISCICKRVYLCFVMLWLDLHHPLMFVLNFLDWTSTISWYPVLCNWIKHHSWALFLCWNSFFNSKLFPLSHWPLFWDGFLSWQNKSLRW